MDPNDEKIQKVTAEAAGLDCTRAMEKALLKIKEEILRKLELKKQKVDRDVAEMRIHVAERTGHLNLLREQLRSKDELIRSKRQYQAQLVIRIEEEQIMREKLLKELGEMRDRMKATWEDYLEVYNRFPLAREKAELEKKLKLLQFQNKYEAQKREDKRQIIEQMRQVKQMIRESREKKVAELRAGLEEDKARIEELARIKAEKLEELARLKALVAEKERQKQLSEVNSTGSSGRPLPVVIPPTSGQISLPSYGISQMSCPASSQMLQLSRSQMQNLPSSLERGVFMSFNRRIIEERCLVVVSPRRETTTPPTVLTANRSSAQQGNCSTTDYADTNDNSAAVTGQGTTIDQPMEVQVTNPLVDVEYGGSDSSQSSSKDLFSQEDSSHLTQSVRPAEPSGFPQLAAESSAGAQTSDRNTQLSKSIACTSFQSTRQNICPSTVPLHSNNDRSSEKMTSTLACSSSVVYTTTQPSPVNATPSSQMRPVSVASPTSCAPSTHQNFASPAPRHTQQIFASPAPHPTYQNSASPAPRPTHPNSAPPAHRATHQNIASPASTPMKQNTAFPAPRLMHQTIASPALSPTQNIAFPAPRLTHQTIASPALSPTQNIAFPAPRLTHQTIASPALNPTKEKFASPALNPTQEKFASPALNPTQEKFVSPARPIQQNPSSTTPSSTQSTVNKTALLPTLHCRANSRALSTPGSSKLAPLTPALQMSRFHPYASPTYPAFKKPVNTVTSSSGRASPAIHSASQPIKRSLLSAFHNQVIDDRSSSSQPEPVRPALGAESMSTRMERTSSATAQPSGASSLANQKSQSPVPTATTASKATLCTAEHAATNVERTLEDSPIESEKSQYFNQQPPNSENQQAAIVNPESERQENVPESDFDRGKATSESIEILSPLGYAYSEMGDELTTPPFSKDDDVEVSPPPFTSLSSPDFETADPPSEVRGLNFGFSSLFRGSNNVTRNGESSGQANETEPFSFAPAPIRNIFKLF